VLTGRGWAALVAAALSLIAGRVLGLVDVFIAGVGLSVTLLVCLGYVSYVRPSVVATRRVQPPKVHAGGSSRVELALVNQGARRTPVLGVRDPFDRGARWARFLVAPLAPGELARAAYRLPTERRGVFDLGPLTVRLTDPFTFFATSTVVAPLTQLTVYPRIDRIAPLPSSKGDDPLAGADHPHTLSGMGDDFYALRPYVRGDDLRRVHWPSTARTDELMIRQDEMPWQGRATVVVDTRAATTTPDALELVLSAAASIVSASWQRRSLVRLVTTGGYDSGFAAGHAHVDDILEHLAQADTDAGNLARVLATLRRAGAGGGLALVTTASAAESDLRSLATLQSRYGSAALVLFDRSSWAPDAPAVAGRLSPPSVRLVRVSAGTTFAAAWGEAFGPADGMSASSLAASWSRQ
jgi:uncharacterized protein (DUF58 family)